jgi:succinate-acetate transporter protein
MTTFAGSRQTAPPGPDRIEARVFLQPIAAPVVLGWYALSAGLIMFGTWFAGAWGNATSPEGFFPFVLLFAGAGQLAAAMWSFRGRDAVSAALHGSWAAFWAGWGVMWLMATAGAFVVPPLGHHFAPMGQWLIYMAAISLTTAIGALARGPAEFLAHLLLCAGAATASAGFLLGSSSWETVSAWLFVAAAGVGIYVGTATMLANVFGMVVLPLLRWKGDRNVPRRAIGEPVAYEHGDPGVKAGQ